VGTRRTQHNKPVPAHPRYTTASTARSQYNTDRQSPRQAFSEMPAPPTLLRLLPPTVFAYLPFWPPNSPSDCPALLQRHQESGGPACRRRLPLFVSVVTCHHCCALPKGLVVIFFHHLRLYSQAIAFSLFVTCQTRQPLSATSDYLFNPTRH